MYPLNVSLPAPAIGFAVANDETEHAALSAMGYVPALVAELEAAPQEDGEQTAHLQTSDSAPDGAAPTRKPGRPRKAE